MLFTFGLSTTQACKRFIVANVLCCLVNVFVQFVHQLFVLFVDFVGDSEFILHGLKRILGHVANRLDGGLSSLVQSSIGVSFQVNYLQSEASKRVSSSTYIVDYMVCSSQKLAWSIGSPMTTVSFDHGTFDRGRLTAGQ